MVGEYLEELVQRLRGKARSGRRGEERFRKEYRPWRSAASARLLLDSIARAESSPVSDEDIDQAASRRGGGRERPPETERVLRSASTGTGHGRISWSRRFLPYWLEKARL